MPYFLLAIALAGFGAGFGTAHQIDKAEIVRMEDSIVAQNAQAHSILSSVQQRIATAQAKAADTNANLEQAHESSIQTINYYRDALDAVRLRDPGSRPRSHCPVSTSTDTGKPEAETGSAELSTELTGFLQTKFYAADQVAVYANECYAFVVEHHCGIQAAPVDSSLDKSLSVAH